MGKVPANAPSRQRVICGHRGCNHEAELRNMKKHNERKHDGVLRIKNSSFGVGGKWARWNALSLGQDEAMEDTQEAGSMPESSSSRSVPDPNSTGGAPPPSSSQEGLMSATLEEEIEDDPGAPCQEPAKNLQERMTSLEKAINKNLLLLGDTSAGSSKSQHTSNLSSRMATLEKAVSKVLLLFDSVGRPERPTDTRPGTVNESAFRSARSIVELRAACGGLLCTSQNGEFLYCSACAQGAMATGDGKSKNAVGIFSYDCGKASFSYTENLSGAFRAMKDTVKRHFTSERHVRAEEAAKRKEEQSAERSKEAGSIALRVLRTAHYVLTKSLSQTAFEELIVLQHMNGLNMGNLNHSKAFMTQAREAFHREVLTSLAEHVKSQPCVALSADKATVNKRTLDITAITTVVPEAPVGSMIQSFVVGAPVVKERDGDGHSQQLRGTIASLGITRTEQLSGIAADGQVHHNGVPTKLLSAMSAGSASSACVPRIWDGAHLMNLADLDARSATSCRWVNETVGSITRITKRFLLGAGLERLLDAGSDLGCRVLRPRLWSETRFAPYAADVMHTFTTNVTTMTHALQQQLKTETRRSVISELREELKVLKDKHFLARVDALLDVYKVMAEGSRSLQRVQSLPWESMKDFGTTILTLKKMSNTLESRRNPSIAEMHDLAEIDTIWPALSKCEPLDQHVCNDAAAFSRSMAAELRHRRGGLNAAGSNMGTDNQRVMDSMGDVKSVADLQRIRDTTHGTVNVAVGAIHRLVARRLVPQSCHIPRESVLAAHTVLHEPRCAAGCNQQLLKVLWQSRDSVSNLQPYVELVVRLWLISPTETVVESMASTVQEVFGVHRQLDHSNAARELVVRWNGPGLCRADGLIRAVQRQAGFNFVRHMTGPHQTAAGAVITRHKNAPSAKASIYN